VKNLNRMWWTPLSFVILALVVLLVTPIVVERQVSEVRDRVNNGSDRARVVLNDLEAGFASRLLRGALGASDTLGIATDAQMRDDSRELASLLQRLNPSLADEFDELRAEIRDWDVRPRGSINDSLTIAHAKEIFARAEKLDASLAAISDRGRAEARRIEAINVDLAVALAPIALLAVIVVIWAGSRVVRYADAAEAQRLEVLRAADARAALLRGVTHDVKNPLGAALGYAELLEEGIVGDIPQAQREMVERIRRLVEQSVDTVTDLLELARADSGGLAVEYEQADLATIVGETVEDHRARANERHLTMTFRGESAPVITDPRRVRQVLSNLISNAIKYTPEGGSVEITITQDRESVGRQRLGVRVADDGPGIPTELRPRLFEEFFRVRSETGAQGHGLGLAISRRIARLLGGEVTFEPRQPHGAVFTLWLERRPESERRAKRRIAAA
jgi:signal transduction histidine kinase